MAQSESWYRCPSSCTRVEFQRERDGASNRFASERGKQWEGMLIPEMKVVSSTKVGTLHRTAMKVVVKNGSNK